VRGEEESFLSQTGTLLVFSVLFALKSNFYTLPFKSSKTAIEHLLGQNWGA
jgi:hypothetical protein